MWFFLGILSAHRFYLGKPGTSILPILTFFIQIGLVWLLVDAFLIPGMIRKKQDDIRSRLESEMLARGSLLMRF